jgi:hypothetical protein
MAKYAVGRLERSYANIKFDDEGKRTFSVGELFLVYDDCYYKWMPAWIVDKSDKWGDRPYEIEFANKECARLRVRHNQIGIPLDKEGREIT